jgi:hypothetical protein
MAAEGQLKLCQAHPGHMDSPIGPSTSRKLSYRLRDCWFLEAGMFRCSCLGPRSLRLRFAMLACAVQCRLTRTADGAGSLRRMKE